jgi:hypothetical protein
MFRFTIRNVLWLTVVVGLACGWRFEVSRARHGELELVSALRRLERDIEAEGYDTFLRDNGRLVKRPRTLPMAP